MYSALKFFVFSKNLKKNYLGNYFKRVSKYKLLIKCLRKHRLKQCVKVANYF